jgi:hypothetical protein
MSEHSDAPEGTVVSERRVELENTRYTIAANQRRAE